MSPSFVDFLFMEGYAAVFKIALSILSVHKELILSSDSFEATTETLKRTLPEMGNVQMTKIFNEVRKHKIPVKLGQDNNKGRKGLKEGEGTASSALWSDRRSPMSKKPVK